MNTEQNRPLKIQDTQTNEVLDLMELDQQQLADTLTLVRLRGLLILKELLGSYPVNEQTIMIMTMIEDILHNTYSINIVWEIDENLNVTGKKDLCKKGQACTD